MNEFLKLFTEASGDSDVNIQNTQENTMQDSSQDSSNNQTNQEDNQENNQEDISQNDNTDDNMEIDDNIEDESEQDINQGMGMESEEQEMEIEPDIQLQVIEVYNNIESLHKTVKSIITSLINLSSYNVGKIYITKSIELFKQLSYAISKYLSSYENDGDVKAITTIYNSMYKSAVNILTTLRSNVDKDENNK